MNNKTCDIVSFSHKIKGFRLSARNKIGACDCSGRLVRAAPALTVPITMLLMLYSGAALATSARLAWDPSTYLPLSALLPRVYDSALKVLPLLAGANIAIAFLLLLALRLRSLAVKRATLFTHAALMIALMVSEAAYFGWLLWRVGCWLASEDSDLLSWLLVLLNRINTFLEYIGEEDITAFIEETKRNALKTLHVALWSSAVLAVLQGTTVALAFLCVASLSSPKPPPRVSRRKGIFMPSK